MIGPRPSLEVRNVLNAAADRLRVVQAQECSFRYFLDGDEVTDRVRLTVGRDRCSVECLIETVIRVSSEPSA